MKFKIRIVKSTLDEARREKIGSRANPKKKDLLGWKPKSLELNYPTWLGLKLEEAS